MSVPTNEDFISASDEKQCPYCAETIKAAAVVCRHCGKDLATSNKLEDSKKTKSATETKNIVSGCVVLIVIIIAGILCFMNIGDDKSPKNPPVPKLAEEIRKEQIQEFFTDSRDSKNYRTVKIGNKTWMAENLNFKTDNSWCYENNEDNCEKYGRLYSWNTAVKACPAGWRLPTRREWNELVAIAGDNAGTRLKSKTPAWNGTDEFMFSALPGGSRDSRVKNGDFYAVGASGLWWTATENTSRVAYYRYMGSGHGGVGEEGTFKDDGNSVRCIQD
jgi:uncharacterized protein (TIGR02145 family)